MSETLYPKPTREMADKRRKLAPEIDAAFRQFSQAVFNDGALSPKTKQLIAVAVAHVTQCPYCIQGHTKAATREGATAEELMEAIWVAAEMRAGGAFAHSALALSALDAWNRESIQPWNRDAHDRRLARQGADPWRGSYYGDGVTCVEGKGQAADSDQAGL